MEHMKNTHISKKLRPQNLWTKLPKSSPAKLRSKKRKKTIQKNIKTIEQEVTEPTLESAPNTAIFSPSIGNEEQEQPIKPTKKTPTRKPRKIFRPSRQVKHTTRQFLIKKKTKQKNKAYKNL